MTGHDVVDAAVLPDLPTGAETCEEWDSDRDRPELMSREVSWPLELRSAEPAARQFSDGRLEPSVFVNVFDTDGVEQCFYISMDTAIRHACDILTAYLHAAQAVRDAAAEAGQQ